MAYRRLSIPVIALLATPAWAAPAPPIRVVETGQGYYRLADAVAAVADGNATIEIAPGTFRECAVQQAGNITYRAVKPLSVIFDGTTCEGKAALVLRGRSARIEGLIFQNLRVADGNGAGIRLEKGALSVFGSIFRNSEQGILTSDDAASLISIDRSTFSGLGRCDRGLSCAHSIYIGHYGGLTVTRSRFERGDGGHYVKSRAARVEVSDCSFDDVRGRTTNYMIDLPAGATGLIARNIFVQGANKENHSAMITVAAEAHENSSAGLIITGNRADLGPMVTWQTVFIADWSHEPLRISNNRLGVGIKPFETR